MKMLHDVEIKILNIQIGCVLRLARLRKGLSQQDLSLLIGYNPIMIGRIERFENISSWDKIYTISKQLEVNISDLFILKSKEELLSIVEESYKLEDKLTSEKKEYFKNLKISINNEYLKIK